MTLQLYQIIILIVSTIMIYQGINGFIRGKGKQTVFKLLVRITVWGSMAVVAVFPRFTDILASAIGIADNINAVILTGFLLVFLMIFKLLSAIERVEQNVSALTRKDSLKEITNDGKK